MDDNLLTVIPSLSKNTRSYSIKEVEERTKRDVFINSSPNGLQKEFQELLTEDAIDFLVDLQTKFEDRIEALYNERIHRKSEMRKVPKVPKFIKLEVMEEWKIAPVSERLKNRHLDLGDVSPSNLRHFESALRADVQGIQVDFDDGHCPTWSNQIFGLHNVYRAVWNLLPRVPKISKAPILVLRPRAWNMIESNMSINGKNVPGSLFDFALLIFHNGQRLHESKCGPAFYLSKIESSGEAKLWNDIFSWTELRLRIPYGSIKACVLIENILASFEMETILYELKDHSLGLNCGIWDYAASIISKFGNDKSFLLPDRNKYVNMERRFLKKYMQLVVKTCHKRGAHATGGMAAKILPKNESSVEFKNTLRGVCQAKLKEIQAGVDGFMVYDVKLVPHINNLWKNYGGPLGNQISYPGAKENITEEDLLTLPKGGVTMQGLDHNIRVAILFNYNWLNGRGHFVHQGSVEDSATAEISRSQIWQWIRHQANLEDVEGFVTRKLVNYRVQIILVELEKLIISSDYQEMAKLSIATDLFFDLVNARDFPEFVTSFISNGHPFKKFQAHL